MDPPLSAGGDAVLYPEVPVPVRAASSPGRRGSSPRHSGTGAPIPSGSDDSGSDVGAGVRPASAFSTPERASVHSRSVSTRSGGSYGSRADRARLLGRAGEAPSSGATTPSWASADSSYAPLLCCVKARTTRTKPSALWVIVPVFAGAYASFAYRPSLQEQAVTWVCHDTGATDCNSDAVTGKASDWYDVVQTLSALSGVVLAGTMGSLSDRYGRLPMFVLSWLSALVYMAASAFLAVLNLHDPDLYDQLWAPVTVSSNFVGGIAGGMAIGLMLCFSYAADLTTGKTRGAVFVCIEACIGVGGVVATYASGWLTKHVNHAAPFIVIVSSVAVALFMVWCVLPDSVPTDVKRPLSSLRCSVGRENTWTALQMLRQKGRYILESQDDGAWCAPCVRGRGRTASAASRLGAGAGDEPLLSAPTRRVRMNLALLAGTFSLSFFALYGWMMVNVFYFQDWYSWGPETVGEVLALQSGTRAVVGLVAPPILHRFVGGRPTLHMHLVRVSLFGWAISVWFMVFARHNRHLMVILMLLQGTMMAVPYGFMRGMFSRSVAPHQQGKMLSAIAVIEQLVGVGSPFLFNAVYGWTVHTQPFTCFYVMLGFLAVALLCTHGVIETTDWTRSSGDANLEEADALAEKLSRDGSRTPLMDAVAAAHDGGNAALGSRP